VNATPPSSAIGQTDGYEAVKRLAQERPDFLEAVKGCYEEPEGREFAGKWIVKRLTRGPTSLGPLARRGILESVRTRRGGRRAYYRVRDREGVGRALRELDLG
jgi:hypothetical protein